MMNCKVIENQSEVFNGSKIVYNIIGSVNSSSKFSVYWSSKSIVRVFDLSEKSIALVEHLGAQNG